MESKRVRYRALRSGFVLKLSTIRVERRQPTRRLANPRAQRNRRQHLGLGAELDQLLGGVVDRFDRDDETAPAVRVRRLRGAGGGFGDGGAQLAQQLQAARRDAQYGGVSVDGR